MKRKTLFSASIVVLLMSGIMLSPVYAITSLRVYKTQNKKYEPVIDVSQNPVHCGKIQLTPIQLEKLNEFVKSIKNKEKRKIVQSILDKIITDNGQLDVKAAQNIAAKFYESINHTLVCPCGGYDGKRVEVEINKSSTGTVNIPIFPLSGIEITVFKPINANTAHSFSPWDPDGYHWGDTIGVATERDNANAYSGCIGTLTDAWIGGAVAEGMQYARFYADQLEIVYVDAEIYYTGGGKTFGIAAFAGTYKSNSYWMPFEDSWETWLNNYYKSAIDSPWDPEDIIPIIISIVSMWASGIEEIAEAIENIDLIVNYFQLLSAMQDLVNAGKAEVYHVTFGFIAERGYHEIYVGLRSQASGCVTGTGVGVAFGQVSKITVYEIPL